METHTHSSQLDGTAKLDAATKEILAKVALTIRGLTMDATQKANSGHPGLPMGCAELGAYLWGVGLRYNPKDPNWLNRDRFYLSAGHGCLLLYSCLHLSGYDLTMEDLKQFRQLHSKTPGHPEKRDTPGVESTTGPLGQGIGNAVGAALGLKLLAEKFNGEKHPLFTNKVVCLAGDGCIMEGISGEASSLAGHLKLDNLILFYDANNICLDGPLSECCSEETKTRYKAYGWDVFEVDGHDFDSIHQVYAKLRAYQERPALVVCHTIIGKGAPHKEGTHKAHGSPLGSEEVKAAKAALGIPEEEFYVPQVVKKFFATREPLLKQEEAEWKKNFENFTKELPQKKQIFDQMVQKTVPADLEKQLQQLPIKSPYPGRTASQEVVSFLGNILPYLYGGSADLSGSDMTMMKQFPLVTPTIFSGRNIKYGVREFAMAAMANGLEQTQMILPFIGTFLTFSDYMRNAIRLAALQRTHVIYQFTHDSIFLGEDGPTHQSVEHYAALRAIPHLQFIRPSGNHEVKMAWLAALNYVGPTAFALSRQNIVTVPETEVSYAEGMGRGGYVVKKESSSPAEFTLLATGSELPLAVDVAKELEKRGHSTRVISMPCWSLFDAQEASYKESLLGKGKKVSIEAGIELGWHKYIGSDGICICMEDFGLSAPASDLAEEFGFTVDAILERIVRN